MTSRLVNLKLVGVNGNAFAIMGAFRQQAGRDGWTKAEIDEVLNEAMSKDYTHLVATIMDHCVNGGTCLNDEEEQ